MTLSQFDWLQSNWERVVEASFDPSDKIFLEIYGEGGDCNASSSRVWNEKAIATHRVICMPINMSDGVVDVLSGKIIRQAIVFDGFCTVEDE